MSKWHDITPETGDPKDLPPCDDTNNYIVTSESSEGEVTVMVFDGEMIHECAHGTYKDNPRVIAWREMPRAYDPSKLRKKIEHNVVLQHSYCGGCPVRVSDGKNTIGVYWEAIEIILGEQAADRVQDADDKSVCFKIYLTEVEQDKQ